MGADFRRYYYFIYGVGRKANVIAARLLLLLLVKLPKCPRVLLALDDTPTKRYGPKVQGAGIHTLVELWSWRRWHGALCDRSASPWDDPTRGPSHADRRNALRRNILRAEF